jgi:Tol biopolymer transport system component
VDETSGVVSGSPEPVTNGVRPISSARFARDGVRLVTSAMDRSFNITLYDYDPAHPERVAPRSTLHSPTAGWCMPSKDGSWLACTTRSGQEDIVLMRADGSETRRLTDDPVKDRIPIWSPDDKALAFMSTRSGHWDLWTIGADGSGLKQLTSLPNGDLTWAVWSPDGRRIATTSTGFAPFVIRVLDPARPAAQSEVETIPAVERDEVNTWSSDGRLLAGSASGAGGEPTAVIVWDANARRELRRVALPLLRATAADVSFVNGTHDVIVQTVNGVAAVDADSGHARVILKVPRADLALMSGDGRTLLIEREAIEADLWLMELTR